MKRVSQAIMAALGLVIGGSALAAYDSYFDYARVMQVDKIVENSAEQPITRQECWNEPRDEYHPTAAYRSESIPIGDGEDRVIRTRSTNDAGYYTRTYEQHCRTQTDYAPAHPQVAFDVVYRYNGEDFHDRMIRPPGSQVRVHVENGYVELAE